MKATDIGRVLSKPATMLGQGLRPCSFSISPERETEQEGLCRDGTDLRLKCESPFARRTREVLQTWTSPVILQWPQKLARLEPQGDIVVTMRPSFSQDAGVAMFLCQPKDAVTWPSLGLWLAEHVANVILQGFATSSSSPSLLARRCFLSRRGLTLNCDGSRC